MSIRSLTITACALALLALAPAAPARAQTPRADRPYRGLFAGGLGEIGHLLSANGSVGAGWDSNLVADALGGNRNVSDIGQTFEGGVYTVSGGLSYTFQTNAFSFSASGTTTGRYYPTFADPFIIRNNANLGTSSGLALGRGFTLRAAAAYQPFGLRMLAPLYAEAPLGDTSTVDLDFPTSRQHYFSYSAGIDFNRQLSQRNTFTAGYGYASRLSSADIEAFSRQIASAAFTHSLTRSLGLRFGYTYTTAGYGSFIEERYGNHQIDAGLTFNRALSLTRRTSLSFGSGTSASRGAANGELRFRATGNATLNHEIGRSWVASGSYNRGLQFVETWPEPLFTDSISASLSGLPTRRTQAQMRIQGTSGSGQRGAGIGQNLRQYSGAAGLSFAINRYLNTGVSYTYYNHDLGESLTVAPGLTNNFRRQSVRVFVSVWAPILQGARRP